MFNRQNLVRIVCLVLACLMLLSFLAAVVFAADSAAGGDSSGSTSSSKRATKEEREEMENRIKELERQREEGKKHIEALEASIENNENAAAAAKQLKEALEADAALLEEKISLQELSIDNKIKDIDVKKAEIVQKQKEYDDNYELFCQRLVAMYKSNTSSTLSTVFNVDSLAELLAVSRYLQEVSRHDTDMMDRLEAQRVNLEEMRAEMEVQLADLEDILAEQQLDLANYRANIAAQQAKESEAIQAIAWAEEEKERARQELEEAAAEIQKALEELKHMDMAYFGGDLLWPIQEYVGDAYISSHFGARTLFGRPDFHSGMDIWGPNIFQKDIMAAATGVVVLVSTSNPGYGYGNYLIIDHGGNIRTLYAHCDSIQAVEGQSVSKGDSIAKVGNTGRSTGPHLHFEVRINNVAQNPYPYLTGQKTLE